MDKTKTREYYNYHLEKNECRRGMNLDRRRKKKRTSKGGEGKGEGGGDILVVISRVFHLHSLITS